MQETWLPLLGLEGALEKGMATHSSVLPWEIPWTESPWSCEELGTTKRLTLSLSFHVLFALGELEAQRGPRFRQD